MKEVLERIKNNINKLNSEPTAANEDGKVWKSNVFTIIDEEIEKLPATPNKKCLILENKYVSNLETNITLHLNEGYILHGNIVIYKDDRGQNVYMQILIKY